MFDAVIPVGNPPKLTLSRDMEELLMFKLAAVP
jgi:hypothetical protein